MTSLHEILMKYISIQTVINPKFGMKTSPSSSITTLDTNI